VPGVQELEKIEGFSSSDLTQNYAIGAMAEGCLEKIADGHCRKAILLPACFKADEIFLRQLKFGRVLDNEHAFLLRNEFPQDGK